ncbi:hypothetical protein HK097_004857, partial [Rhizophlyctis rosea]
MQPRTIYPNSIITSSALPPSLRNPSPPRLSTTSSASTAAAPLSNNTPWPSKPSYQSTTPTVSAADQSISDSDGDDEVMEEELYPCENFNLVTAGIYRSAFPKKKNFTFLKKLGLKSILTLILEDYPEVNKKFLAENNITLFQFGVAGNKEPFVDIPEDTICAALSVILDRRNHPCESTSSYAHRTGCLIGCIRKLQHWSHTSIFDEYRRFSHPKSRSMDQQFIELFDVKNVRFDPLYLPSWPEIKGTLGRRGACGAVDG